jgi:hypothetical protein
MIVANEVKGVVMTMFEKNATADTVDASSESMSAHTLVSVHSEKDQASRHQKNSINISTVPSFDYQHRVVGECYYSLNHDGLIKLTHQQLIIAAVGIDNPGLTIAGMRYTGFFGILMVGAERCYYFSPNENFQGDIVLEYTISNGLGSRKAKITIELAARYTYPLSPKKLSYTLEEDRSITCMQNQLLYCVGCIENDEDFIESLAIANDGVVIDNGDGSFNIAAYGDFVSSLELKFSISTGFETLKKDVRLTVNLIGELMLVDDSAGSIIYNQIVSIDRCFCQLGDDGVLTFTQQNLASMTRSHLSSDDYFKEVEYDGHDGVLIDNSDGSWSFWTDPIFAGVLTISIKTTNEIVYKCEVEVVCGDVMALNDCLKVVSKEMVLLH